MTNDSNVQAAFILAAFTVSGSTQGDTIVVKVGVLGNDWTTDGTNSGITTKTTTTRDCGV